MGAENTMFLYELYIFLFLGRIHKCAGSMVDFRLGNGYLSTGGGSDVSSYLLNIQTSTRAPDIAQQVKMLVDRAHDVSSVPRAHMVEENWALQGVL